MKLLKNAQNMFENSLNSCMDDATLMIQDIS